MVFNRDYLTTNSDGTEQVFYTRFKNLDMFNLRVWEVSDVGVETELSLGTDYSFTSASNGIITLDANLPPGYGLFAKYTYTIIKASSVVSPYVDTLRLFGWRDAIR